MSGDNTENTERQARMRQRQEAERVHLEAFLAASDGVDSGNKGDGS